MKSRYQILLMLLLCSVGTLAHAQESTGAYTATAFAYDPVAPSYTLTNFPASYNPKGTIDVLRSDIGNYEVRFNGLGNVMARRGSQIGPGPEAGSGGTVHVVAADNLASTTSGSYCKIGSWINTGTFLPTQDSDLVVNVLCFDPFGTPTDQRFDLFFVEPNINPGKVGFAYVDEPAADKSLVGPYGYNAAGGDIAVNHLETGRYTVTFDNMGSFAIGDAPGAGAIVHATAQGSDGNYCQLTGWDDASMNKFAVDVACFSPYGNPVNSRFNVLAMWPEAEVGDLAFALADDITNPGPYVPTLYWNNESSVEVTRSGRGTYRVRFPDLADGRLVGYIHVTPRGSEFRSCNVFTRSAVGDAVEASVACRDSIGDTADAAFSISAHYALPPDPGDTDVSIDFSEFPPGTLLQNQLWESLGIRFPKGIHTFACNAANEDCPRARSARSVGQGPSSEFSREPVEVRFQSDQSEVSVSVNGSFIQDGSPREVTMIAYGYANNEIDRATATVTSDPRWNARLTVNRTPSYSIRRIRISAKEPLESVSDNQFIIDDLYFDNEVAYTDVTRPSINFRTLVNGDLFESSDFQTRVVVEDLTLEEVSYKVERRTSAAPVLVTEVTVCSLATTLCPFTFNDFLTASLPVEGEYIITVMASDAFGNTREDFRTFYYLPPAPVFVHKVEFNQSVTNRLYGANTFAPENILIIPGKDLLVRYYMHSEVRNRDGYATGMRIHIEKSDGSEINQNISPNAGNPTVDLIPLPSSTGTARRDTLVAMRSDLSRTLNFVIPGDWFEDAAFVQMELWDGVERLSIAQINDVGVNHATLGLQLVYVNDQQYLNRGRDNFDDNVRPYLEKALPFSEVEILSERAFDFNGAVLFDLSPCAYLVYSLSYYGDDFGLSGLPVDTRLRWTKVILSDPEDLRGDDCVGIANRPGRNAMSRFIGGSTAHEIGHNIGLRHASNAHGESDGGSFEEWPFYHGAMGTFGAESGTFGVIIDRNAEPAPGDPGSYSLFLIDPCPTADTNIRFAPGGCSLLNSMPEHQSVPHELMSYGTGPALDAAPVPETRGRWPSFLTYGRFLSSAVFNPASSASELLASSDKNAAELKAFDIEETEMLIVSALIGEDGSSRLLPIGARAARFGELAEQPIGDYLVELIGEDGLVMTSANVVGSEIADEPGGNIFVQAFLPFTENIGAVRIKKTGETLLFQPASLNSPTVQVLSPNGIEQFGGDTMLIDWNGGDGDGDDLTYLVEYSPDNGENWVTLRVVMPGNPTEITIPTAGLVQGIRGRIRVTASDGINITRDLSNGYFSVGPEPPVTSYDIYSADPASGTNTRLTFLDETDEYNPDWSPDGDRIVHDVVTLGEAGAFGSQDLFITDVAMQTSTPLVGGEGGNDASWSPDGTEILFDRCPFGSPAEICNPSLYRVSAAGGTPDLVRHDAIDGDWAYTGKLIVFHQPSDGSVRTRHLVSGRENVVARSGSNPVWSYDDKYIAYEYDGDIFRIRVNGSGKAIGVPEQLTTAVDQDGQPSWNPNNRELAFHSDRSGDFDIFAVEIGGTPTQLAGKPASGDYDPSWSSDGESVAYARYSGMSAGSGASQSEERWTPKQGTKSSSSSLSLDAYPNPFNPTTMLQFNLVERSDVRLEIFDILGRRVAQLINGTLEAGSHGIQFDASSLPSGTYIYRLIAGSNVLTKSISLIR